MWLPLRLVCGRRQGRGNAQKPVGGPRLDICTTLKFAEVLLIRRHDGRQRRGLLLCISHSHEDILNI